MKKILIVSLLIISVIFLGIEIIGRLFFKDILHIPIKPNMYQPDSVVNYIYQPNLDYLYKPTGTKYHFNNLGFMGEDFPEKDEHKFRIAFIGDSFTSGVIYFDYYTSFCEELQHLFDENGYHVEILNCSIDGSDRGYDNYKMIHYKVVDLKPDMILLSYELPLMTQNLVREVYKDYRISYHQGNDSLRTSYINIVDRVISMERFFDIIYPLYTTKLFFRRIRKWNKRHDWSVITQVYAAKQITTFYEDWVIEKFSMEESVQMILSTKNELTQDSIRFFLYTIARDQEAVEIAKQYQLPLISLNIELTEEERFPKDKHANKRGNQKIAARFYALLTKHALVPR